MENFDEYKFKIIENRIENKWFYQITFDGSTILRESNELFETEAIARYAAIGHISLLKQGKG